MVAKEIGENSYNKEYRKDMENRKWLSLGS